MLDMQGAKQCFGVCTHRSMLETPKVTSLLRFKRAQDEDSRCTWHRGTGRATHCGYARISMYQSIICWTDLEDLLYHISVIVADIARVHFDMMIARHQCQLHF